MAVADFFFGKKNSLKGQKLLLTQSLVHAPDFT